MKIQHHRIGTNVVVGLLVREFRCSGTDVSAKVFAMYAGNRTPPMEPQWLAAGLSQDIGEIGQCPASGSFPMDAMIVVPCSMKTVAGIASGYSDNLLLRAADVTIKEARPLILVPRESPLSPIHLRNLQELSAMGVRIVPPMISFYQNYTTIEEWTNNFVERLLESVGLKNEMKSWRGM